jgi:hypothetical protein
MKGIDMKYINDNYTRIMNTVPEYKKMISDISERLDEFMVSFDDSPKKISRWGHYYFCEEDGGRLIFDLKKPHHHKCEVCGKEYTGEILDGVWVTFYRNAAVVNALLSAAVYKATGEKKYLDYAKHIVNFYASTYKEYTLHNKENESYESYEKMRWGCGKMMPQGLNEAIVAIRISQTIELLKDDLEPGFIQMVYDDMFSEIFKLLSPQVNEVHNIAVWNLAAIGTMGLLMQDEQMIKFAFESKYNISVQLEKGVTSDYFWYEGSIHYNFFLLEGVSYLLLFSKIYNYDFGKKNTDIIENMFKKAYSIAFDNDYFPNPNDGWPNLNLKTYSYIYHTVARVFGENSEIGNIVKNIENKSYERTILPLSEPFYYDNKICLEQLLFNIDFDYDNYKEIKRESYNCKKSCYAMLRNNKMNAFVKYGLNGKSHAHPDIMNVELSFNNMRISRDLSNAGYRARLCNEWHRKTLAHNTVIYNARDMTSVAPGETLDYDATHISVLGKDIYEGVNYKRSIEITENVFEDIFEVISEKEGVYDYVFHFEGQVMFDEDQNLVDSDLEFNS